MHAAQIEHIGNATARPSASSQSDPSYDADYRRICIATVAVHKAKERGFAFGYESQDWLDAEAEVLAHMYGLTGSGS